MMKTGIYFGTTSGNTEEVAQAIQRCLGSANARLHDIATAGFRHADSYELLIFGLPTWDCGHLQTDWEARWRELDDIDFSGRKVALFGLGDQYGYADTYLDALGMLHAHLQARGATLLGEWPTQGYTFDSTLALSRDGSNFVGLALDEESQGHLTEQRVAAWCRQLVGQAAPQAATA